MLKKKQATGARDFARDLAKDKKFRKELISAIGHGTRAQRRASRKVGFFAVATRLSSDPKLRREVKKMTASLDKAWSRVEKKRSHKLRNTLLVLGGIGGAIAAALPFRKKLPLGGTTPTTISVLRSLWLRFFSTRDHAFCIAIAAARRSSRSCSSATIRFAVAVTPIRRRARSFAAALCPTAFSSCLRNLRS